MSRCWAYNQNRDRCEGEAGHDGLHTIVTLWGDEDCWTPDLVSPIPLLSPSEPEVEHFTPAPPDYSNAKCFCEHPYHGKDICGVPDANDVPCDCANAIAI